MEKSGTPESEHFCHLRGAHLGDTEVVVVGLDVFDGGVVDIKQFDFLGKEVGNKVDLLGCSQLYRLDDSNKPRVGFREDGREVLPNIFDVLVGDLSPKEFKPPLHQLEYPQPHRLLPFVLSQMFLVYLGKFFKELLVVEEVGVGEEENILEGRVNQLSKIRVSQFQENVVETGTGDFELAGLAFGAGKVDSLKLVLEWELNENSVKKN